MQRRCHPCLAFCCARGAADTIVDALLASIECGAIAPLRGRFLVEWAASGKPLPRRQDLPPEAFFPLDELRRLVEALGEDWGLLFVALSYRWLAKDHPDPERFHLETWRRAGLGETNFAFFQDFACLFQKPRTPAEDELFKQGLSLLDVWYGHEQTVCWQQSELPPGFAEEMEALGLARSYEESGWCFVEAVVSAGVKVGTRRLDLGKRTELAMGFAYGDGGDGGVLWPSHMKLEGVCAARRHPPLQPDEARRLLVTEKKFTTGKEDVEVVDALYRRFFEGVAGTATALAFSGLKWGPAESKALAAVLPRFVTLESLDLSMNELGAEGATELAGYLRVSASLTEVQLGSNQLKDEGVTAICNAVKDTRVFTSLIRFSFDAAGLGHEGQLAVVGQAMKANLPSSDPATAGEAAGRRRRSRVESLEEATQQVVDKAFETLMMPSMRLAAAGVACIAEAASRSEEACATPSSRRKRRASWGSSSREGLPLDRRASSAQDRPPELGAVLDGSLSTLNSLTAQRGGSLVELQSWVGANPNLKPYCHGRIGLGLTLTCSRIDTDQPARVVLLGHSKGAVDAAAALSLFPELRGRVAALVSGRASP
ncbi:hypothetical protein EMIHUDRAFT_457094 [Emiliania huxleyi CCMP1516]|uniref:Uncharacterized protein n=2 Tax=Emiliania huxleyi TaxID=2903 RepID=A0A0D3JWX1_EMIH1|nr:hypothetical protein EMIHUDRAFT_457094 [Emiliania huxleyi CCMP1516]EOD28006.1 hypothetical protein EMIHUDRAFT_457094 [Emiliania huxleyi CCMP1516]|eukprot:XP_005780435.1 hypothetical protein EMIHUDRAFT_457094 [Emiliania huxleyi CCMP1516]